MSKIRSLPSFWLLILLMALLAACAQSELTVINSSNYEFCALYLSPCEGDGCYDRLHPKEGPSLGSIAPGETFTLGKIKPGFYEVHFLFCYDSAYPQNPDKCTFSSIIGMMTESCMKFDVDLNASNSITVINP